MTGKRMTVTSPRNGTGFQDSLSELIRLLQMVYTPEGVQVWLADANRKRLTVEDRLVQARMLIAGADGSGNVTRA